MASLPRTSRVSEVPGAQSRRKGKAGGEVRGGTDGEPESLGPGSWVLGRSWDFFPHMIMVRGGLRIGNKGI